MRMCVCEMRVHVYNYMCLHVCRVWRTTSRAMFRCCLAYLILLLFFLKKNVEAKSPSSWALTSQAGLNVQRTPRVSLICLPRTEILRLPHYLAFSLLFFLIWDKHRSLCCKSNVPSLSYRHPNRMLEGRCSSRYNHSLACHCRGHS